MKWPNDLQWQSAKLAGILVEVTRAGTARMSPDHYVAIIGLGLNQDEARALSTSFNRKVADWSTISAKDRSGTGSVGNRWVSTSGCRLLAARYKKTTNTEVSIES